jgi:hypothetical protein
VEFLLVFFRYLHPYTNCLNVPNTNHHLAMPMHIRLLADVSVQCRFFILKHMSWRGFVSELPESIAKLPFNVSSVCEAEWPWSKNMSRARVLNLFEVVQDASTICMCHWLTLTFTEGTYLDHWHTVLSYALSLFKSTRIITVIIWVLGKISKGCETFDNRIQNTGKISNIGRSY